MSGKYEAVHSDPHGPGDERPTALQIVHDEQLESKLTGKVFLVTGGFTSGKPGLGTETVRALLATGATVYATVRDPKKSEAQAQAMAGDNTTRLHLLQCDLESLASVRACAAAFKQKRSQLNVLICNAGVMACPKSRTADGFERHIGTNHFAHFALFQELLPALLASSTPAFNSRIVMLTARGHQRTTVRLDDINWAKGNYDPHAAYGQSKTANIWTANEIERRYGAQGLHATSVHPGIIGTNLARFVPTEALQSMMKPIAGTHEKSLEQGAATTVWAAISNEWEGKGGKYLENCSVSQPCPDGKPHAIWGFMPHAYDEEGAKQLWELSVKAVSQ